MGEESGTGWLEYRRLVLNELERLDEAIKNLDTKLDERNKAQDTKVSAINLELLTLKIKASVYGALAGAIFSALVAIGSALLYRPTSKRLRSVPTIRVSARRYNKRRKRSLMTCGPIRVARTSRPVSIRAAA